MKKTSLFFNAICMIAFLITSCNNGNNNIEMDAKKVAELQCQAKTLSQKAASGDVSVLQEAVRVETEAADLYLEMLKKYPSNSEKLKFDDIILKEMNLCQDKELE
ncbi:MAG: hypothetical protein QM539_01035 [Alphaproteobacteria bacterium]|nr:hypothetical protein [Alphaproteobacteria bacterium]